MCGIDGYISYQARKNSSQGKQILLTIRILWRTPKHVARNYLVTESFAKTPLPRGKILPLDCIDAKISFLHLLYRSNFEIRLTLSRNGGCRPFMVYILLHRLFPRNCFYIDFVARRTFIPYPQRGSILNITLHQLRFSIET